MKKEQALTLIGSALLYVVIPDDTCKSRVNVLPLLMK